MREIGRCAPDAPLFRYEAVATSFAKRALDGDRACCRVCRGMMHGETTRAF